MRPVLGEIKRPCTQPTSTSPGSQSFVSIAPTCMSGRQQFI